MQSAPKLQLHAASSRSHTGVMPRAYWIEPSMSLWKWSFHLAMGNEIFPFVLIALQLAAALTFMAGYRARIAGAVTCVLMCSLQSRNYRQSE